MTSRPSTGIGARLGSLERSKGGEAPKTKEAVMDGSSGTHGRSGWTWKVWVGIVVGLAVVAGLVVLIAANAGGGSGGIY
jgi:hypothetical protein